MALKFSRNPSTEADATTRGLDGFVVRLPGAPKVTVRITKANTHRVWVDVDAPPAVEVQRLDRGQSRIRPLTPSEG